MEVVDRVVNLTSEKAQTSTKVVNPSPPATGKGTEGSGSSTTDHCGIGRRLRDAASIQDIRTKQLISLECKELALRSDSGTLLGLKSADQRLMKDTIPYRGTCKTVPVSCEHNGPQEYSMESGFVSSGEISVRIPSLQFFVMSEGGINLYLDLSSSPSEWISSLKDGVCVHQNAEHRESVSLSRDISNSPEVGDHMKISPSVDTAINLQGIVVVQDTGCTNSSLSSVVSENCNSGAYPHGTTVVTSDVAFCHQEVIDPIHASFEMVKSNASLPDASTKSITGMDNVAIVPITVGISTTKTPCADFIGVENNVASETPNSISDKSNLPASNDTEDNTDTSSDVHLKNHNGAEASFMECTNELLDNANLHGGLLYSYQLNEQMVLDGPMADAQSEVGITDGPFHKHECINSGTLVPEDHVSMFHDESVQTRPARGKKSSTCSRSQTLDNGSKRSNNSEISEELHAKRQHICCENKSRTIMDLKSSSSSVKEAISDDIVMPRRSTRLVSKAELMQKQMPQVAAKLFECHALTIATGDDATHSHFFPLAIFHISSCW